MDVGEGWCGHQQAVTWVDSDEGGQEEQGDGGGVGDGQPAWKEVVAGDVPPDGGGVEAEEDQDLEGFVF